jgi:hypothetical protein
MPDNLRQPDNTSVKRRESYRLRIVNGFFRGSLGAARHRPLMLVVDGIGASAISWVVAIDRHDYAALGTPVTSAQVVKAWFRAE